MISWSWSIIERLMTERNEALTQIKGASREIQQLGTNKENT